MQETLTTLVLALNLLSAHIAHAETLPEPTPVVVEAPDLLSKYHWDVNIARAVMMAESGGNPKAYNPEWHNGCQGSIGLFQLACLHASGRDLLDPAVNVQVAYDLYKREGWQPWSAYKNGAYLKYLK